MVGDDDVVGHTSETDAWKYLLQKWREADIFDSGQANQLIRFLINSANRSGNLSRPYQSLGCLDIETHA
jgi:hypothetical protein